MKLLFDFFPIVLFFIAYKTHGIFVATAVVIAATVAQVSYVWIRSKKIESMHLVTLAIIIVFGGATLIFKDEAFIKWKPTIINWIFGIAFLASHFIGRQPLIERLMGKNLTLPANVWSRLNMIWVLFFLSLGCINLYVIYSFDTDTWVNFKLFGMLGLMLAFIVVQTIYLSRYMELQPESKE